MAKKKSSRQKTESSKEFSSSPFKKLKGLSDFVQQKPGKCDQVITKDKGSKQGESFDKQPSFADEMAFLGVHAMSSHDEGDFTGKKETAKERPLAESIQEDDAALFLSALGSLGKTFKDEWQEEVAQERAVPRRMRQLQRGQLMPEATLDLHGLTVAEATDKAGFFLQDAAYHDYRTILLVTGKGLHSNDEPVLRKAMEELLNMMNEQVLEWGVAPRRYGGDGALVVFLRGRKDSGA